MAFLGPILGGIGALFGASSAKKGSDAQANLLQQEYAQHAGEYSQMENIFGSLIPFFQQYMGKGSPILNQVQTGSAENIAREFGGAEAQTAEKLGASGYGFTPSGATAGAFGDIETAKAEAGTNTFLQNLLANEATKFKAAQGLQGIGESLKPGGTGVTQVQPSPTGAALQQIGTGVGQLSKYLNQPGNNAAGNTPSDIGFTPPGTLGFGGDGGGISA